MYRGGKFLFSKNRDVDSLCDAIYKNDLHLRIAFDIPQIYTAHNVKKGDDYIKLMKEAKDFRQFIGGVHLWGKRRADNGRKVSHCWICNTACPGPYLKTKFRYIADEVNKILTGDEAPFLVRVIVTDLYIRKGAGTNYKTKGFIKPGVYTIVETKGEWGRLKSGAGWICLDFANRI